MGLIICDNNEVLHPYYIEELNLHIYSYEELCFIIYENPVLVRDRFITSALFDFIEMELGLGTLKARLVKMQKDRANHDEMLIHILNHGNIYSHAEILKYKKLLEYFKRAHKADYLFLKANYMFGLGLFGRAASDYQKILKFGKDKIVTNQFLAMVQENLGSAYANLFQYASAYQAYEQAYLTTKDPVILRKMYHITLIEPSIGMNDDYLEGITKMEQDLWDKEYLEAIDRAGESGRIADLHAFFNKSEPSQKDILHLLNQYKQSYRRMN